MSIKPINQHQKQQVCDATSYCLIKAEKIFKTKFKPIKVDFDLSGRSAGMYLVQREQRKIRYNAHLFAKYFDDNLAITVPHEVAHYITDVLYGLRHILPHGAEWQAVMCALGVEPRATGQYDLSGIPVRRQRRFTYHCNCNTHQLTTYRHYKICRRKDVYICKQCGEKLVSAE